MKEIEKLLWESLRKLNDYLKKIKVSGYTTMGKKYSEISFFEVFQDISEHEKENDFKREDNERKLLLSDDEAEFLFEEFEKNYTQGENDLLKIKKVVKGDKERNLELYLENIFLNQIRYIIIKENYINKNFNNEYIFCIYEYFNFLRKKIDLNEIEVKKYVDRVKENILEEFRNYFKVKARSNCTKCIRKSCNDSCDYIKKLYKIYNKYENRISVQFLSELRVLEEDELG